MPADDHLNGEQFDSLWHVTTREALPSIQQHGLNNELSTTELWSNVDDWESGAYMWDSPKRALEYSKGFREGGHRPVVVRVNPRGLNLTPDDTGATEVTGAFHAPHVPAGNIEVPHRYRMGT